jgi:regulator of replication initiation timing
MFNKLLSKWNLTQQVPIDDLYYRVDDLYEMVMDLKDKVKYLENENVELTNELYRLENSLDARIDILTENPWRQQF